MTAPSDAPKPPSPEPTETTEPHGADRPSRYRDPVAIAALCFTVIVAAIGAGMWLGVIRTQISGLEHQNQRLEEKITETQRALDGFAETLARIERGLGPPGQEGWIGQGGGEPSGSESGQPRATAVGDRHDGKAGIIEDSLRGRTMFCRDEIGNAVKYDPALPIIAVSQSLRNNGIIPCGTLVRVDHHLEDGNILHADARVSDVFPDWEGLSPDSPLSRKFNLSMGLAFSLQMTGLAFITVEILALPQGTQ